MIDAWLQRFWFCSNLSTQLAATLASQPMLAAIFEETKFNIGLNPTAVIRSE